MFLSVAGMGRGDNLRGGPVLTRGGGKRGKVQIM